MIIFSKHSIGQYISVINLTVYNQFYMMKSPQNRSEENSMQGFFEEFFQNGRKEYLYFFKSLRFYKGVYMLREGTQI